VLESRANQPQKENALPLVFSRLGGSPERSERENELRRLFDAIQELRLTALPSKGNQEWLKRSAQSYGPRALRRARLCLWFSWV
jgi:hypothetical protein